MHTRALFREGVLTGLSLSQCRIVSAPLPATKSNSSSKSQSIVSESIWISIWIPIWIWIWIWHKNLAAHSLKNYADVRRLIDLKTQKTFPENDDDAFFLRRPLGERDSRLQKKFKRIATHYA